jgi:hypothetical protein
MVVVRDSSSATLDERYMSKEITVEVGVMNSKGNLHLKWCICSTEYVEEQEVRQESWKNFQAQNTKHV